MILLGIDTCGSVGTLAIAQVSVEVPVRGESAAGFKLLGSAELPGRSAAAGLVPALDQLLSEAGVGLEEITGLVVVDGPGSFTGIRIGLSTAKALAEARALPLYAVSRLRVLAEANHAGCAALEAGRGECYYGAWAGDGNQHPAQEPAHFEECLWTEDELAVRLAQAGSLPFVVCEQKVADAFPGARLVAPPTAADAVRSSLAAVLAGRPGEVEGLDGRYLRRADLYRTLQDTPSASL